MTLGPLEPTAATRWFVSERVLSHAHAAPQPLAVGVRGPRVVALAPAREARQAQLPGLVDFGQRPLLPSFVNAHVHLAMAPLRGITSALHRTGNVVSDVFFRIESRLTEADVFAFARLGAFESLLFGVGEVWDHYYFGDAVARALVEVGLSGVVAPTLQDRSGPFAHAFERELENTKNIQENLLFRERGVSAAVGPHATDTVSDALFERAFALSQQLDIPVHLHLAQSYEEMREATGGVGVAARALGHLQGRPVLAAHGSFLSSADVELLTAAQWTLGYCPLSQVQFGFQSPISAWQARGGRIAVGTDCVASNDALSVQRELPWLGAEGALATGYGAQRQALLATGTLEQARELEDFRKRALTRRDQAQVDGAGLLAVGLGEFLPVSGARRGVIEVGAPANFQVLEPDAPELYPDDDLARRLAYGETSGALHALIVAGRLVGEAGAFRSSMLASAHYRDALTEARARRTELLVRAGV